MAFRHSKAESRQWNGNLSPLSKLKTTQAEEQKRYFCIFVVKYPSLRFFLFFVSTILGRDTKPLNLWNIFRGSSFVLAQIWSINHLLTFEKFRILKEVVKLTKHSWDFKVLILLFSVSPPLRFTYGI